MSIWSTLPDLWKGAHKELGSNSLSSDMNSCNVSFQLDESEGESQSILIQNLNNPSSTESTETALLDMQDLYGFKASFFPAKHH